MKSVVGCLLVLGLAMAGCNEDSPEHADDPEQDAGEQGDAAAFQGCPDSIPTFELGMSATGSAGHIKAVLRDASGVPPVRYFNDWTLEFTDADGQPLDDVEVVRARAYMRVHNHYGTPDPNVTQHDDAPSLFDFKRINLFMRGPWEVQLTLRSERAGEDDAVFNVCVDE
jgi:hypothetical protein